MALSIREVIDTFFKALKPLVYLFWIFQEWWIKMEDVTPRNQTMVKKEETLQCVAIIDFGDVLLKLVSTPISMMLY